MGIHSTQAWRKLARQTIQQQPTCWLQLPGCTHISTTADHVIPVAQRPDLALAPSNVRGACKHCNYARGRTPIDVLKPPTHDKARDFFETDRTATSGRG